MATEAGMRTDDQALRRAVERLSRAWFWWFVLGAVWSPLSAVLGAWVLAGLVRLALLASGEVAARLWLAAGIGVAAAGMSLAGQAGVSTAGVWAPVAVGMALYSLALGQWCDERGCDEALRRSWRRAVDWAVVSAAAAAAFAVVHAARPRIDGWSDLLTTGALVVTLPGALVAVALATVRLRDGLGRQVTSRLAETS